jgi:hypothetical protein
LREGRARIFKSVSDEKENEALESVTLVFVDGHTEQLTPGAAMRACNDPERAGYIVDALTENETLQRRLRTNMDDDRIARPVNWKKIEHKQKASGSRSKAANKR